MNFDDCFVPIVEQSLIASSASGGVMEGKSNSHSSTIVSSNAASSMCVGASNTSNSNTPSVGVPLTPSLEQVMK